MRSRASGLPLIVVALACAPEPPARAAAVAGGTIVISAAADVDALIPPLITQSTGRQVAEQIFDRLAEIGEELNTVSDAGFRPVLAERWEWSPDSLSIAFHLRGDARWHDGRPVTADDVRFTHTLYTDPRVSSPTAAQLGNIDSVSVADSLTAVFWFARTTPAQFFEATYFLLILPQHLLDTVPPARLRQSQFARQPTGSGRFRFARWTPAASLELVSDTTNYRGRARPDRVVWLVATDFNAAAARFFSGAADVFEFLRPEQIEDISRREDLRALVYPSLDYGFVQFNLRNRSRPAGAHPVLAERGVRVALTMAVDRASLVRNVFDTLGAVAIGPAPRGLLLADTTVRQLPFDVPSAERMLDSLGWRDSDGDGVRDRAGRRLEFTLIVPSSSRNRVQMAVLLQEQLRRIGARMSIEQLEYGAFIDRGRSGRFDAMFGAWRIDIGPGGIRQTWGTPGSRSPNGLNYGSYENPVFDAHVDSALAATDLAAARAHFRQAQETIIADAPAIWMYEPRATLGLQRRLVPVNLRADAWWAGLPDWSVNPAQRLARDDLGLESARR